ncbi:MAG: hypothetical protein HY816_07640 [Candidatus Wallbacteria bacterium]|nr:hypothetical protein [Candidatus Wallbacteria bacterium]
MAAAKTSAKTGKATPKSSGGNRIYAEADKLIDPPVTRERIEEAVSLLEDRLDDDPADAGCRWRIARAFIRLLEAETGTVLEEKREYYPILDECGKRALAEAERAHEQSPRDPDCVGWHMVSYGYYSVSIGIVRAVLQGAAGKYLALADELNALDERWLAAAGWRAMGRFYREAPWPKRDLSRSVECFTRAVELGPKRQENKLHLALALADDGEEDEAIGLLEQVAKGKPEPAEAHIHRALVAYARQKLGQLGG